MKKALIILLTFPLFVFESYGQKGKLIKTIITELPVSWVHISPDKKLIAVADDTEDPLGFQDLDETYRIKIFNSYDYSLKFELLGHIESIESINFSPDSKILVSTSKDGTIIIWQLSNGKKLCKIETGEWVHNAKFSNSGNDGYTGDIVPP